MINNVTRIMMEDTRVTLSTVFGQNAPHPAYMVGDAIDLDGYICEVVSREWKAPELLLVYVKLRER